VLKFGWGSSSLQWNVGDCTGSNGCDDGDDDCDDDNHDGFTDGGFLTCSETSV